MDLVTTLFNIAKQNTEQQEPIKKKYIEQKNEEYESKLRSMANLEKLKPIAEEGNYHVDVIDIDGSFQYTCYDLQRLVIKLNKIGNLPLKVHYEKSERVDLDFDTKIEGTYYMGVNCKASFRWEKGNLTNNSSSK